MVVEGKFKVEIILADTKVPFLEHTTTGDNPSTYSEVEPDADYFVRIESKSEYPVLATIKIDGEDLGYQVPLHKSIPYLCGIISMDTNGGTRKQALKFVKSTVLEKTEENQGIAPMYWTGSVDASFYECVPEHDSRSAADKAFGNSWNGHSNNVGFMRGRTNPDKKKGVMSAAGDTVEYVPPSNQPHTTRYKRRGLLKTITLKYCSTLGLIYAGILPKPPCWQLHRMTHPAPQIDHNDKMDDSGAIDLSDDP